MNPKVRDQSLSCPVLLPEEVFLKKLKLKPDTLLIIIIF